VDENPIGKTIRIGNLPFRVDGVLESKGQNVTGQDQDDVIFAPYTTVQRKISGITWLQFIAASAVSQEASVAAVAPITSLLRERHRIRNGDDDFLIRTQADIADLQNQTQSTMTYLLGGIASVSLLVGGIGIMNIMLATVSARIREIGIRKALGATNREIRFQFLSEAVLISVGGGLIGVVIGLAVPYSVRFLTEYRLPVSGLSAIVAIVVSSLVGILFGTVPAARAAKLDPVESLRYE
jgi:putative ABC transport system permease protein